MRKIINIICMIMIISIVFIPNQIYGENLPEDNFLSVETADDDIADEEENFDSGNAAEAEDEFVPLSTTPMTIISSIAIAVIVISFIIAGIQKIKKKR